MIEVKNLRVRYGAQEAVSDLSFAVDPGQWLMLVGPNGAGKSTALAAIAQSVPYAGEVLWNGVSARTMKPRRFARHVGMLLQTHRIEYGFTVEEVVRLGRYAHRCGFCNHADAEGEACVETALRDAGLLELRYKSVLELSGGEVQRVFLAQVFAQNPELILLDEPANHLDLLYQQRVFSLLGHWLSQNGHAIISVVHDLSLARRYATHAVLLENGHAAAMGLADETLTRAHLQAVYGMDVYEWMRCLLARWAE
ncbi:MAG: ABC transporter ATP-binding protein [Clostridia bacterium]